MDHAAVIRPTGRPRALDAVMRASILNWLAAHGCSWTDAWHEYEYITGALGIDSVAEHLAERYGKRGAAAWSKARRANRLRPHRDELQNLLLDAGTGSDRLRDIESAVVSLPGAEFLHLLSALHGREVKLTGTRSRTKLDVVAHVRRVFRDENVPIDVGETPDGLAWRWRGDDQLHEEVIAPAESALADPRFAEAARRFDRARLRAVAGPDEADAAVVDAGGAVESALAVVLDALKIARPARDGAQNRFRALVDAGVLADRDRDIVMAATVVRNLGAHSDSTAPDLPAARVTATISAAAVALRFLAALLAA